MERVQTPCPDGTVRVNGERVIDTSSDVDDVSEPQSFRLQTVQLSSSHDPPSELVLLSTSPDVNMTSCGQSQDVVLSTCDLYNLDLCFGKSGKCDRRELKWIVTWYSVETENAFVSL